MKSLIVTVEAKDPSSLFNTFTTPNSVIPDNATTTSSQYSSNKHPQHIPSRHGHGQQLGTNSFSEFILGNRNPEILTATKEINTPEETDETNKHDSPNSLKQFTDNSNSSICRKLRDINKNIQNNEKSKREHFRPETANFNLAEPPSPSPSASHSHIHDKTSNSKRKYPLVYGKIKSVRKSKEPKHTINDDDHNKENENRSNLKLTLGSTTSAAFLQPKSLQKFTMMSHQNPPPRPNKEKKQNTTRNTRNKKCISKSKSKPKRKRRSCSKKSKHKRKKTFPTSSSHNSDSDGHHHFNKVRPSPSPSSTSDDEDEEEAEDEDRNENETNLPRPRNNSTSYPRCTSKSNKLKKNPRKRRKAKTTRAHKREENCKKPKIRIHKSDSCDSDSNRSPNKSKKPKAPKKKSKCETEAKTGEDCDTNNRCSCESSENDHDAKSNSSSDATQDENKNEESCRDHKRRENSKSKSKDDRNNHACCTCPDKSCSRRSKIKRARSASPCSCSNKSTHVSIPTTTLTGSRSRSKRQSGKSRSAGAGTGTGAETVSCSKPKRSCHPSRSRPNNRTQHDKIPPKSSTLIQRILTFLGLGRKRDGSKCREEAKRRSRSKSKSKSKSKPRSRCRARAKSYSKLQVKSDCCPTCGQRPPQKSRSRFRSRTCPRKRTRSRSRSKDRNTCKNDKAATWGFVRTNSKCRSKSSTNSNETCPCCQKLTRECNCSCQRQQSRNNCSRKDCDCSYCGDGQNDGDGDANIISRNRYMNPKPFNYGTNNADGDGFNNSGFGIIRPDSADPDEPTPKPKACSSNLNTEKESKRCDCANDEDNTDNCCDSPHSSPCEQKNNCPCPFCPYMVNSSATNSCSCYCENQTQNECQAQNSNLDVNNILIPRELGELITDAIQETVLTEIQDRLEGFEDQIIEEERQYWAQYISPADCPQCCSRHSCQLHTSTNADPCSSPYKSQAQNQPLTCDTESRKRGRRKVSYSFSRGQKSGSSSSSRSSSCDRSYPRVGFGFGSGFRGRKHPCFEENLLEEVNTNSHHQDDFPLAQNPYFSPAGQEWYPIRGGDGGTGTEVGAETGTNISFNSRPGPSLVAVANCSSLGQGKTNGIGEIRSGENYYDSLTNFTATGSGSCDDGIMSASSSSSSRDKNTGKTVPFLSPITVKTTSESNLLLEKIRSSPRNQIGYPFPGTKSNGFSRKDANGGLESLLKIIIPSSKT